MSTPHRARVFKSGNSQAVRLPRSVAFPPEVHDVLVRKDGNRLVLEPMPNQAFSATFWSALGSLPTFRRPKQTRQRRTPIFK